MFAFIKDTCESLRNSNYWLYTTWFKLLIKYRRMFIGPLWILAGPLFFILFLGGLFTGYSNAATAVFIPHLTCGFIIWTLIGGYLNRGPIVFQSNRANLLLEKTRHTDILFLDNAQLVIHFLHQVILVVVVCFYFGTMKSNYAFLSLLGLLIIILNGYWISFVLGLIGARFKDLSEVMSSLTRVAFFATPIIWIPKDNVLLGDSRKSIFQIYMDYNPFYHFVEIFRAPLLGNPIAPLTWYVVGGMTISGYIIALVLYWRFRHIIVYWI